MTVRPILAPWGKPASPYDARANNQDLFEPYDMSALANELELHYNSIESQDSHASNFDWFEKLNASGIPDCPVCDKPESLKGEQLKLPYQVNFGTLMYGTVPLLAGLGGMDALSMGTFGGKGLSAALLMSSLMSTATATEDPSEQCGKCHYVWWAYDANCKNLGLQDPPQECSQARVLDLRYNDINRLHENAFAAFRDLNHVDLQNNHLTYIHPNFCW